MRDPIKEKARVWAMQLDDITHRIGFADLPRYMQNEKLATAVEPLLRAVEAAKELTNELDNPIPDVTMRSTRRNQLRNAIAALPKELR